MGSACSSDRERVSWDELQMYILERRGIQNVWVKRYQDFGDGRGTCGPVRLLAIEGRTAKIETMDHKPLPDMKWSRWYSRFQRNRNDYLVVPAILRRHSGLPPEPEFVDAFR